MVAATSKPSLYEPGFLQQSLPYRVVSYFAEWSIYARNYIVSDLPAPALTHVNYAFAKIDDQGEVAIVDAWAATDKPFGDDTWDTPLRGNLHALIKLKQKYPHISTLISIGGWSLSDKFSDVALTDASRQKFAASAVAFMKRYQFDGVDIDWEYPVSGGLPNNKYRPEDSQNYVLLCKTLRQILDTQGAADGRHYLLTVAAAAGDDKYANFKLSEMAPYLDWFNIMSYDYHGSWETQTNHQAALFGNPADPSTQGARYSADYTIQHYIQLGVPASKIVMGAPIYGRGWAGVGATNNGLFQSASGASSGTWENGIFDYKDLLQRTQTQPQSYVVHWDSQAEVPYIYAQGLENGLFTTFENAQSIQKRVEYIKKYNLGGIMFWEASADVKDPASPDSLTGTAYRGLYQ
ncbi:hypothetical protein FGO68_gene2295 [Halteria grandinella]|uniref:GH18 domain-containing protein n=1 Tax=Halteria grandinella TaxID=5974 RepID=A0A8J8NEA0_HALGN|nr:hypothetical protein FGO68_gene2295 [Halteria grandinella]